MACRGSSHIFSHSIICMQWPSPTCLAGSRTLHSKSPGNEKPLSSINEKSYHHPKLLLSSLGLSFRTAPSQLSPFPYKSMLPFVFGLMCVKSLSHVQLFVTLWTTRLLCPWNSPGKIPGMGCHVLLQGIFPTQG